MESDQIIAKARSLTATSPSPETSKFPAWEGKEGEATFSLRKVNIPINGIGSVYSLLLQGEEVDVTSLATDFRETLGEPRISEVNTFKKGLTFYSWDARTVDERMNSEI